MENIPGKLALRNKLANQLLAKLHEKYPEEIKNQLMSTGLELHDHQQSSPSQNKDKAILSDTEKLRYIHNEEERITKIINIAKEIVDDINSNI